MKLDGKVALITGAASGIGHAIAKRYVEAGGRVVIADLNARCARKRPRRSLAATRRPSASRMDVVQGRSGQCRRRAGGQGLRHGRYPRLECRHPDRASDRGLSLRRLEEAARHPSRRRVSDDQGLRQAHVPAEFGRADLYGLGAQSRGLAAEVGLCGGEARPARSCAGDGQGRRQAQCARQRHLPGLRARRRWSRSRSPSRPTSSASARSA